MSWIEKYQYYMRRTRLLGIIGAGLVVASSCTEMWYSANVVLRSGTGILDTQFIETNLDVFLFAPVIAVIFVLRMVVLSRRSEGPYRLHVASWIGSMAIVMALWTWDYSVRSCGESKLCAGIYDIGRTSMLEIYPRFYIFGSLLRSAATALYATLKHKYR